MEDNLTKLKAYACSNCGAKLVFSPSTQNLRCNYCGGNFDIEHPEDVKITNPEGIVPFKVDENEFKKSVLSWLIEGDYTPIDILKSSQFSGYSGTYFPVFQFQGTYDGNWSASSGYKRRESYQTRNSDGKIVTKHRTVTDWNPSNGKVSGYYDILCYAGENIKVDVELFSESCSFSKSEAKKFNEKYTLDFPLVAFSLNEDQAWQNGERQLDNIVDSEGRRAVPGDSVKDFRSDFTHKQESVSTVYVPIWFTYYDYKGKNYYVSLNGNDSSHIDGIRPEDEQAIAEAKSKFLPRNIIGGLTVFFFVIMFISFLNAGYGEEMNIFYTGVIGTIIGLIATAIAHSSGNAAKGKMITENLAQRQKLLEEIGAQKQASMQIKEKSDDNGSVENENVVSQCAHENESGKYCSQCGGLIE